MTVEELRVALLLAEMREEMWALLVQHAADEVVQLVMWNDDATEVRDLDRTREVMSEWLLTTEIVPCDAALEAGAHVTDICERCEGIYSEPPPGSRQFDE